MIYRTTEQFFPSSYIKKRRKIQSDQRQNLAILRPLFLPKKNRFRNTTYCYVSGQHQPNSSPFLAKDLAATQRKSSKSKLTKCGFQCDYVGVTFSRLVTLLEDTREVFKLRCYAQSPFSVSCVIYQRGEDQRGLLAGSTSDWSAATPRRLTGVAPLHPWTPSPLFAGNLVLPAFGSLKTMRR